MVGTAGDTPKPAHMVMRTGRKMPRMATPMGQNVWSRYSRASMMPRARTKFRLMMPLSVMSPARNVAAPVFSTTLPMDMMVPHMITIPQGTDSWNSFHERSSMPGRNMTARPMRATTVALSRGTQLPTIQSTSRPTMMMMALTS